MGKGVGGGGYASSVSIRQTISISQVPLGVPQSVTATRRLHAAQRATTLKWTPKGKAGAQIPTAQRKH